MKRAFPFLAFLLSLSLAEGAPASTESAPASTESAPAADSKWAGTIFLGRFYHDHLQDILFTDALFTEPNYRDSRVVTLSLARELARWRSVLSIDAEGMLGKHFGMQRHVEANALLAVRWHPFPWDRLLDTSLAIGDGLSWASEPPYVEGDFRNKPAHRFLNYLLVEVAAALPAAPRWSLVSRIHHRSGVFGLYGTREGSNFVGFGLRRRL